MTKNIYKPRVIIIGAGYAGLTTALKLSKLGINCTILEQQSREQWDDVKGEKLFSITSASEKFYQKLKLDVIAKEGQAINHIRVWDYPSSATLDFSPREIQASNFGYMIIEHKLLEVLRYQVLRCRNIQIKFGVEKLRFALHNGYIAIEHKNDIENGELAIIANGREGKILPRLGFAMTTKDYHQYGLVCSIKHEKEHYGVAVEQFMPGGPFAILPQTGGHHSSLVWTVSSEVGQDLHNFTQSELLLLIQQRMAGYLGDIKLESPVKAFPLVLQYCKEPVTQRIVVIGDAAHAIHPIAGQGLNLSITDIAELSSQIKHALKLGLDIGSRYVLSQYWENRKLNTSLMIEATDQLNSLFNSNIIMGKAFRRLGMKIIDRTPWLKNMIMHYATNNHL